MFPQGCSNQECSPKPEQFTAKVINPPGQDHLSCLFPRALLALLEWKMPFFTRILNTFTFCICVPLALPLSAKGIQLISGSKSCREDFGTESSHNPHPAGNHTWNYGKSDSTGGRKGECWKAPQCVQNQKIQAGSNSKISLAASTSLGMSFGCSSWECDDASHPAQLLSIRLLLGVCRWEALCRPGL